MNNFSEENALDLDFSSLLDSPSLSDAFSKASQTGIREGEKYVVFELDDKFYAIHSRQVVEVIGFLSITPLPFVPEWIAGITNLRGDLVSVVDLRKLWRKTTAPPAKSKMLILRSEKKNHPVAFIVDKLSEMIALTPREIKFSAEDFASGFPTFFGRATRDAQTIYLLDVETLFSSLSSD
jgi:purine-binding chemotaxis protein CheW